jgi:hypothetical protein
VRVERGEEKRKERKGKGKDGKSSTNNMKKGGGRETESFNAL